MSKYVCLRSYDDSCSVIEISFNGEYYVDKEGTKYDPVTGFAEHGFAQILIGTISDSVAGVWHKHES